MRYGSFSYPNFSFHLIWKPLNLDVLVLPFITFTFVSGEGFEPPILSLLLSALMITAVFTGTGVYAAKLPGDANGDGMLDNKDVVVLFRYVSGNTAGAAAENCDYNGDGERLLLFFTSPPFVRPIRAHAYSKYFDVFERFHLIYPDKKARLRYAEH